MNASRSVWGAWVSGASFAARSACVAAALLLMAPWASASKVVAFVADLQGEVAVGGKPRPALMSEVASGQKITLGADARLSVMFLQSGKELSLRGPGEYAVGEADVSALSGAAPVAREMPRRAHPQVVVNVARSAAASTRMRDLNFVPGPQYPRRGAIASAQPTLRWRFDPSAAPGEVKVTLFGEDQAKLLETRATGNELRLPAPLEPGRRYFWMIEANGAPLGEGAFRVLPAEALAQVAQSRPPAGATFAERLLFALQLQELGADADAREAWAALAQERPDLEELARLASR